MIDFMVMEAIYLKVANEDAELRKQAEEETKRKEFKEDHSSLEEFR